jgi:hypothetical protein
VRSGVSKPWTVRLHPPACENRDHRRVATFPRPAGSGASIVIITRIVIVVVMTVVTKLISFDFPVPTLLVFPVQFVHRLEVGRVTWALEFLELRAEGGQKVRPPLASSSVTCQ